MEITSLLLLPYLLTPFAHIVYRFFYCVVDCTFVYPMCNSVLFFIIYPMCNSDVFHLQVLGNWSELKDGAKYRELLEGNLFQSSRYLRLGRRFTFQQDNDHTAKIPLYWFKGKHLHFLEWSRQRPDLNSIENLWYDLNTAVHQRNPSNLKQFCLEEWAKIPVARHPRCAKLIERLAAVIAAKGGSTKYWFWWVNSYAHSHFMFFCLISCLFHKKTYFASSKW